MARVLGSRHTVLQLLTDMETLPLEVSRVMITASLRVILSDLKLEGLRVTVDGWPNWSCVLVDYQYSQGTSGREQSIFKVKLIFSKSEEMLMTFRQNCKREFQSLEKCICVFDPLYTRFNQSLQGEKNDTRTAYSPFYIDITSVPTRVIEQLRSLPTGFTFGCIQEDELEALYDYWGANDKLPLELIRHYHSTLPNTCIRDVTGICVAWGFLLPWGLLSHLYTLPEFRGRGLARALLMEIAIKCEKHGLRNVGLVENDNVSSLKVCRSMPGVIQLNGEVTGVVVRWSGKL